MRKIVILCMLLTVYTYSQEKSDNNHPIIFTEGAIGLFSYKNAISAPFSISLNYQFKKNIITIRQRFLASAPFSADIERQRKIIKEEANETSFLFGRRFVKHHFSYSFSSGLTLVSTSKLNENKATSYIGLPLEFNIRWFKSRKEKIKILGLIPIGEKTGLGISSGIKFFANISKETYVGLSYTFGFGYYKKYK